MLRQNKSLMAALLLGLMASSGCSVDSSPLRSAAPLLQATSVSEQSLLVMPDMGVAPILKAIRDAKTSIGLEIYMFTNHDMTTELVQALVDKAKAGLNVEVMLDPHPYIPNELPDAPGVNQEAIDTLKAGGVKVKSSNPTFTYTHEKTMIIDRKVAYIMTCNFTNSAFTKNREYIVADTDPAEVAEVVKIFEADWNRTSYVPQHPNLVVSPNNSRAKILKLIDSASQTIVLQCEYLTDPEIAQHLGNRAMAGVDVTIMLSFQPKDPQTGRDINAQEASLLASKGITRVAFPQGVKMHAKTIIVDGARAFVGSENLTSNSLNNNRELGIIVTAPAVLRTLTATARKDWSLN